MLFSFSLVLGLMVLLATLGFLGAAVYHLLQYRLPREQSLTKTLTTLILVSLALISFSAILFLAVPWGEL